MAVRDFKGTSPAGTLTSAVDRRTGANDRNATQLAGASKTVPGSSLTTPGVAPVANRTAWASALRKKPAVQSLVLPDTVAVVNAEIHLVNLPSILKWGLPKDLILLLL